MIDETPGAGPDETTETPATPATDAGSTPETPSADAGTAETPKDAAPAEVADDEPGSEPQPLVHGGDQVAEQVDHDEAQGFHGQEVDKTPNAEYAAPNPPTDAEGTDAA